MGFPRFGGGKEVLAPKGGKVAVRWSCGDALAGSTRLLTGGTSSYSLSYREPRLAAALPSMLRLSI